MKASGKATMHDLRNKAELALWIVGAVLALIYTTL